MSIYQHITVEDFVRQPYDLGCSGATISLSGLYAYYKFDYDVSDSGPSGWTTTNTNVTNDWPGEYFMCGNFDSVESTGTMKYVTQTSTLFARESNIPYSAFTITFWFKLSRIDLGSNILNVAQRTTYSPPVDEFSIYAYDSSGFKIMVTCPGNFGIVASSGTSLSVDTWYHFAVKDAGLATTSTANYKFYLNGTELTSKTKDGTSNWPSILGTRSSIIGSDTTARGDARSYAKLDDLAFWKRRLSDAEIVTLANSTCPLNT
jgi:hypothetical protein